ncbi:MAG: Threonine-phosphate decarboxylase [Syntrophorhabdus sp. PtaU1.Bin050]|nr:MAG: Threonine-phosphate decarboxylase [Syntrophorhabdus sp. PtaU1.Bin050]
MRDHGGDIYAYLERHGTTEENVIDFSASINPLGPPRSVLAEIEHHLNHVIHYPDSDARRLRSKISETHNLDPALIVCGNGCTELIRLVPVALGFKKVLIPSPTYSDYERACRLANPGSTIIHHPLRKEKLFDIDTEGLTHTMVNEEVDAVFLCNPNNPTGRLMRRESLMEIAEAAKQHRAYLVVDESFIDFCPSAGSLINNVETNPYLMILRSMTKFYALPGLRIGYGVFPAEVAGALRTHQAPWSVNTLAQVAAFAALGATGYREETLKIISEQKRVLEQGLSDLGIDFTPSVANYYLLAIPAAQQIASYLEHRGLLVRNCVNFKGLDRAYLRIAVKSLNHNMLLLHYLEEYLG